MQLKVVPKTRLSVSLPNKNSEEFPLATIIAPAAFNFFIMDNSGQNFLSVFAFVWVVTIINLLLLEKIRRMSGEY